MTHFFIKQGFKLNINEFHTALELIFKNYNET